MKKVKLVPFFLIIGGLLLILGSPVLIRLFFDTLTEVGPRVFISF